MPAARARVQVVYAGTRAPSPLLPFLSRPARMAPYGTWETILVSGTTKAGGRAKAGGRTKAGGRAKAGGKASARLAAG